jgi:hypothetical protein
MRRQSSCLQECTQHLCRRGGPLSSSTPWNARRTVVVPRCLGSNPPGQRGHGFLWGLLEFNDRSHRVLTHRAFESSSVVSWRIGFDAREEHVGTAFGTRWRGERIRARFGRLIKTHFVVSLFRQEHALSLSRRRLSEGPLSAVGRPFTSFALESRVESHSGCELPRLGSKPVSTRRSTSSTRNFVGCSPLVRAHAHATSMSNETPAPVPPSRPPSPASGLVSHQLRDPEHDQRGANRPNKDGASNDEGVDAKAVHHSSVVNGRVHDD